MNLDKLINDQRSRRRDLQRVEKFVLGDQWDEGAGWTGPLPKDDGDKFASELVRRQFVQRNALKEVTTRHRDAVVGREPAWDLTSDEKRPLVKLRQEAVDALVQWWEDNDALAVLQEATLRLLFAEETAGKGEGLRPAVSPIRLFLRSSSVVNGEIPKRATLEDALGDIALHACHPIAAGVLKNVDGDVVASRYEYSDDYGRRSVEITGTGKNLAALGLDVDPTDDTLIVILTSNAIEGEPTAFPLEGHLLVHEMTREPLVGPGAMSLQKVINKSWTMMSHNLDVAGFTERVFLNAQSPGRWVDEAGQPAEPGTGKFQPDPLYVGAGSTNHVVGLAEPKQDGSFTYTNPSVVYRDPVDPTAFTATQDAAYRALLQECKQLHVLLSADGSASGVSRRQAASDYEASLGLTANSVQSATRWLLETTLRLASVLMREPDRYAALKPMSQVKITVVQPTSEDIKATIDKREAKLISRETAMTEVGIEDPDAEVERIAAEAADPSEPEPTK